MKSKLLRYLVIICAMLGAGTALGQNAGYDRVLVPVALRDVPGAFGSTWTSILWVSNLDDTFRDLQADEVCTAILCSPVVLGPFESRPVAFKAQSGGNPSLVTFVEQPSDDVKLQLVVKDLSRQARSAGTQIPVVRETEFRADVIRIVNVPLASDFRHLLRIYSLDDVVMPSVRVRVLDEFRREIAATEVLLERPFPTQGFQYKASYAEVGNFQSTFPALASRSQAIVEVQPLNAGLRVWAFLTVTNNEAQHVTALTP